MHLVQEQHGATTAARPHLLRCLDGGAYVLDAGHDGGERDEFCVTGARNEPRKRRFARARRTPQDHRVQALAFEQAAARAGATGR